MLLVGTHVVIYVSIYLWACCKCAFMCVCMYICIHLIELTLLRAVPRPDDRYAIQKV